MLQEDLRLWLPGKDNQEATGKDDKSERHEKDKGDREDLDLEMAHRLLRQVGDQFCDLLYQEKNAHQEHMAEGKLSILIHLSPSCVTINARDRVQIEQHHVAHESVEPIPLFTSSNRQH